MLVLKNQITLQHNTFSLNYHIHNHANVGATTMQILVPPTPTCKKDVFTCIVFKCLDVSFYPTFRSILWKDDTWAQVSGSFQRGSTQISGFVAGNSWTTGYIVVWKINTAWRDEVAGESCATTFEEKIPTTSLPGGKCPMKRWGEYPYRALSNAHEGDHAESSTRLV